MRISNDLFRIIFEDESITSVTFLKRVQQKTAAKQMEDLYTQIEHIENRMASLDKRFVQLERICEILAIKSEEKRD